MNIVCVTVIFLLLQQLASAYVLHTDNEHDLSRINVTYIILETRNTNNSGTPLQFIKGVMKFPPFLEYIVQRIQNYFSHYVYEDLSRPPTVDSPNFGMNSPQFVSIINNNTLPSTTEEEISATQTTATSVSTIITQARW